MGLEDSVDIHTLHSAYAGISGAVYSDRVLISKSVINNLATLDISLSPLYPYYELVIMGYVPVTDNAVLYLRVSTDNGATFDAGVAAYAWDDFIFNALGTAQEGSLGDSEIHLSGASDGVSSSTSDGLNAYLTIYSSRISPRWQINGGCMYKEGATTVFARTLNSGQYLTSGANVNAIRLLSSSGNLSSGTVYLYGLP